MLISEDIVSIIVPMYNCSDCVVSLIDCIKKQSFESWEVLLVDDGSEDETCNVCREYIGEDTRFKILMQEHKGVSAARNLGLKNVSGNYVVFIDADDLVNYKYLEWLLHSMKEVNRKEAIACAELLVVDESDIALDSDNNEMLETITYTNDEAMKKLHRHWNVCGKLFPREMVYGIQFREDLTIAEDLDFMIHCVCKHNIVFAENKNCHYYYIMKQTSAMHKGYHSGFLQALKTEVGCYELLRKNGKSTKWSCLVGNGISQALSRLYRMSIKEQKDYHVDELEIRKIAKEYKPAVKEYMKMVALKSRVALMLMLYCPYVYHFIMKRQAVRV